MDDLLPIFYIIAAVFVLIGLLFFIVQWRKAKKWARQHEKLQQEREELTASVAGYLGGSLSKDRLINRLCVAPEEVTLAVLGDVQQLLSGQANSEMDELLDNEALRHLVLEPLARPGSLSKIRALNLLVHFPGAEVAVAIEKQLTSQYPDVRIAAACAMAERQEIKSVEGLIKSFASDVETHSYLLFPLFQRLTEHYLMDLITLLHLEVDEYIKIVVVDALGRSGKYEALQTLMLFADNDSPRLRETALNALRNLKHPAAEPAVKKALQDPVATVRATAAICAGALGLVSLAETLEGGLSDRDWWVRLRAGKALMALGEAGVGILERQAEASGFASEMARSVIDEGRFVR